MLHFVNVFPGVPEAKVTWFKNKVKLSSTHHLHDGLLFIANVSLSDQGLYSCKAANLHGEVTESSQLLVLGKSRAFWHFALATVVMWLLAHPDGRTNQRLWKEEMACRQPCSKKSISLHLYSGQHQLKQGGRKRKADKEKMSKHMDCTSQSQDTQCSSFRLAS